MKYLNRYAFPLIILCGTYLVAAPRVILKNILTSNSIKENAQHTFAQRAVKQNKKDKSDNVVKKTLLGDSICSIDKNKSLSLYKCSTQEIEKVFDDYVTSDQEEKVYVVKYLYEILINILQKQQNEIDVLRTQVETLTQQLHL